MKILIALPAYNEEKVIARVIDDVKSFGYQNILVINDGSTDKTGLIAKSRGAFIVSHFKNSGLGVSLRTAISFSKKNEFDALVTMDSDGQHRAEDIQLFIDKIKSGCDVVVGSRNFKKRTVSIFRRLILFFSNIYTYVLFGVLTNDSQSGFRGFSKNAIESINLRSERMEVSSEIFAEIRRNKLKYGEVLIQAIYTKYSRTKGQKNSNMFRVAWKLLISIFR